MSDPRAMGAQGGGPQGIAAQRSRESMFNPVDMASKVSRGDVRPDMTVREFFAGMGVDVDGPISQLGEKVLGQARNAGPMSRIRAAGQGGMPQGGMPQGGAPPMAPQGGGMADLMSQLKQGGR